MKIQGDSRFSRRTLLKFKDFKESGKPDSKQYLLNKRIIQSDDIVFQEKLIFFGFCVAHNICTPSSI